MSLSPCFSICFSILEAVDDFFFDGVEVEVGLGESFDELGDAVVAWPVDPPITEMMDVVRMNAGGSGVGSVGMIGSRWNWGRTRRDDQGENPGSVRMLAPKRRVAAR